MKFKKIVCIYMPHIFIEAENHREKHTRPVIITSGTSEKAIVIDLEPSLVRYGISKNSYLKTAEALIGKIDICPANYSYMDKIKQRIILFLKTFSPKVETEGYYRYFFDLTGTLKLFGRAIDTVTRIISELRKDFSLTIRAGIGNNILIASTAAMLAEDNSVYEITPRSERLFIQQLPLSVIPLFPGSIKRLLSHNYNITTISDLSTLSKNDLIPIAGKYGKTLYNISRGISRNFLLEKPHEKGVKIDIIPDPDSNDDNIRKNVFDSLFDKSLKLYNMGLYPKHIWLNITYLDGYQFRHLIKKSVPHPLFCTGLYKILVPYLNNALKRRTAIKAIMIRLSRFERTVRQPWLFSMISKKDNLASALTSIKKKYGKKYIKYGG